jgi:hypothetical protein
VSKGPFEGVTYVKYAECERQHCKGQYLGTIVVDQAGRSYKDVSCLHCGWPRGGEEGARKLKMFMDTHHPRRCPKDHPLLDTTVYYDQRGVEKCGTCRELRRKNITT